MPNSLYGWLRQAGAIALLALLLIGAIVLWKNNRNEHLGNLLIRASQVTENVYNLPTKFRRMDRSAVEYVKISGGSPNIKKFGPLLHFNQFIVSQSESRPINKPFGRDDGGITLSIWGEIEILWQRCVSEITSNIRDRIFGLGAPRILPDVRKSAHKRRGPGYRLP